MNALYYRNESFPIWRQSQQHVDDFSTYLTKFDAKMTKIKQKYTANMIMNVSGAVWQRIHYFPSKQGLAINLSWPALKSKQHRCIELFDIIILLYFFFYWSYWGRGEQIFVKSFAGLVCVYKNTRTGLKCLNVNFFCYAPQLLRGGVYSEIYIFFFFTIYTYKLLQAFPQKHL